MRNSNANVRTTENERIGTVTESILDRRSRWNWILITGTTVAATSVLAGVAALGWRNATRTIWPWETTQAVLPILLALLIVVLVGWVTYQQRLVNRLRRKLAEHRARHHRRLVALLNVSHIMGTKTGVQPVFEAITHTCLDAYDCNKVSLMILDTETEELVVQSVAGGSSFALGHRRSLGEGISGWVAERRQSVVLGETVEEGKYVGFHRRDDAPSASMVVPIIVRDELVGVLSVSSRDSRRVYDEDDLGALEIFAENAGTCIRHAEQAEWMRKLIDAGSSQERVLSR